MLQIARQIPCQGFASVSANDSGGGRYCESDILLFDFVFSLLLFSRELIIFKILVFTHFDLLLLFVRV